jgi:hypothetical protein
LPTFQYSAKKYTKQIDEACDSGANKPEESLIREDLPSKLPRFEKMNQFLERIILKNHSK